MTLRVPSFDPGSTENRATSAKCLDFPGSRDWDPWFDEEDEAAQICNGTNDGVVCPKRQECLIFAAVNNEHYGIWGGLYSEQRQWLRRKNKAARKQARKDGTEHADVWNFDEAPPLEQVRQEDEERKAARAASRSGGDQEDAVGNPR